MRLPATITSVSPVRRRRSSLSLWTSAVGRSGSARVSGLTSFVTIEGAEAVGGYSITSSPADQSTIRLAIKRDGSDHPVTNWLHDDAGEGDLVEVSLGGDFIYTPDEAASVVLIGGGIGMTPLMSIVRAVDEMARLTRLTLVYSASSPDELLFRRELQSIAARNPRIRCVFTVTRDRARDVGRTWGPHRRRPAASRGHRPKRAVLHLRPAVDDPGRCRYAGRARRSRRAN